MKRTFFVCHCGSLEHLIVVSGDEDCAYVEVHLAPMPLLKRIINAFRYIVGRRSRYGDFEEVVLSPETALSLGDSLVHWASGQPNHFQPNDVY